MTAPTLPALPGPRPAPGPDRPRATPGPPSGARLPLLVLVLVLAMAPVALLPLAGPLKVAQALDVLAVLAVVGPRLWAGRSLLPVPGPLLWAGVLLAVVLASTGTSVDVAASGKAVLALLTGLALACAVVVTGSDPGRWLVLVRALLVGGAAVCIPALGAAGALDSHIGGSVVNDRPMGVFAQPNELGAFSMAVALVALGLLLGARSRRDRALGLVALVGSTASLAVSLSRGAWIGTVLGVVTLLVWMPQARRPVVRTVAGLVVGVALLAVLAPSLTPVSVVVQRVGSLGGAKNPYDDRPRIWAEALREVRAAPLLGQGPGSFPYASLRVQSHARTVQAEHAHDVLLTTAAETGLLGVGALVGLTLACALAVGRGLRACRGDVRMLGPLAGIAAALTGFVGEGLVDVTLRNALVAQTVWVVLGLGLSGAALARRRG